MGYSLRTERWRYTEYLAFACDVNAPMEACADAAAVAPRWDVRIGIELYDHQGDECIHFDRYENENLAARPEHAALLKQLHAQLRSLWEGAAGRDRPTAA